MIREILFYFFSAITILASLYLVFSKNPVKAAFSMFIVFLFTGLIYFVIGLHFIGAIQIIIYVGAIMSLFVVALPAMSYVSDENKQKGEIIKNLFAYISAFLVLVAIIPIAFSLNRIIQFLNFNIKDFAIILFSQYWLQIEIVSMLLLVAVVAAYMFLSIRKKEAK